jgi:hypothetical protein
MALLFFASRSPRNRNRRNHALLTTVQLSPGVKSSTLAELVSIARVRPLSLSKPGGCGPSSCRRSLPRNADTTACPCSSGSLSSFVLILVSPACSASGLGRVELGAGDQSGIDDRALLHRDAVGLGWVFTLSKIFLPRSCFSSRWRKLRIAVSSGILSLVRLMPSNRHIVGTPQSEHIRPLDH